METELKQQFDEMGVEPTEEIIDKCIDLTVDYQFDDATEFVEQWMAFSLSHLSGAEPTLVNLGEFERKVLQARRDKLSTTTKRKSMIGKNTTAVAAARNVVPSLDMYDAMYDDGVMDEYLTETAEVGMHTPKSKSTMPRTPAFKKTVLFSPASYSPLNAARANNGTPGGSGDIVYTFGNPKLLANAQWTAKSPMPLKVHQMLTYKNEPLQAGKLQYMFDALYEKTEIALDRVLDVGEFLVQKACGADAKEFDWYQLDKGTQDAIKVVGTIHSDYDGPLDAHSTVLAVPDKYSCCYLNLNFAKAKSVGVFPGQVVVASGTHPQRDMFVIEELHSERELKMPALPKITREISFVVAAGPYTHSDDIIYEPLHDLLQYLKSNKPDVLLLTGPFVDVQHKLISDNSTLAESFDSFFEKMIAGIVEIIGTEATILMVSSYKDANAYPVYPTPPITLRNSYPNLHMLPDPSLVDLGGITVGVTATDVVDHLLTTEFAANAGDKVKRVVNYLLNQGNFYPLNPPADEEMCYDSQLASKFTQITEVPNVLVLPSSQKCFIRSVNDCLVINPGRVADSKCGTFARFLITPPTTSDEAGNLFNHVGCQIRKV